MGIIISCLKNLAVRRYGCHINARICNLAGNVIINGCKIMQLPGIFGCSSRLKLAAIDECQDQLAAVHNRRQIENFIYKYYISHLMFNLIDIIIVRVMLFKLIKAGAIKHGFKFRGS